MYCQNALPKHCKNFGFYSEQMGRYIGGFGVKESYDLTYILERSLGLFSRGFAVVMVELCDVDRCWVSSESAVAGFADGFWRLGVREESGKMAV